MRIRKATQQDLHSIMQLYENARAFMREHGNPGQWGTTYPPQNMIETDIRFGNLYVCIEKDTIEAVFFYKDGIDPTYLKIYDGQWKNDAPYGVVHRITSSGKVKGAASFCLDWAFSQCGNLKIDTHENNIVMQNMLKKNGFTYCGRIYIDNEESLEAILLSYKVSPNRTFIYALISSTHFSNPSFPLFRHRS